MSSYGNKTYIGIKMVKYVLMLFQLHKNKHVPDMFIFRVWGVSFLIKCKVMGIVKLRLSFAMLAAESSGYVS